MSKLSADAVIRLSTLDPAGPLDDLDWLDEAVGDARVVAIGESAHYNREFFQLRHRLLRYLTERHGFGAYAMESGFVEGRLIDTWVRGEGGDLGLVMANGLTSLMGVWSEHRALLEWMRHHDVGFYGIDMPGSMVSLLPGLDAVTDYLLQADPDYRVDSSVRETAVACTVPSVFAIPELPAAYGNLPFALRDALTANLADLMARMRGRRLMYLQRTSAADYERALQTLHITITLDSMLRELPRGDQFGLMLNREVTLADTVEWILGREDRIVLAAHNAHIQRWPGSLPGMPPATSLGMHLADRLGKDYLAIGTTSGAGQTLNPSPEFYTGRLFTELEPPALGSLDALMAASDDGPFATDLRRLSPADSAAFEAVSQQRYGLSYATLNPLDAYDLVVHLPHVTGAAPDVDALTHAPLDIREVFVAHIS
jgi:erythromycin esterase